MTQILIDEYTLLMSFLNLFMYSPIPTTRINLHLDQEQNDTTAEMCGTLDTMWHTHTLGLTI